MWRSGRIFPRPFMRSSTRRAQALISSIHSSFGRVLAALNHADVRYLVVGGLAVVAHGYVRFTKDLDLALEMGEGNLSRAVQAFEALGYRPLVPVPLADLVSAEKRRSWVEEKNARAFHLFSDELPMARIDLLLEIPFEFDDAFGRAHWDELSPELRVPFLGLDDLIRMKEAAGRPTDLADAHKLKLLRENLGRTDPEEGAG
jgi:hypothetical protein